MNKNLSQSSSALQSIQNSSQNEIILYRPNDAISLEVRLENETVWLNRQQIAELFERDRTVIGRHIKNCFIEGELDPKVVCANFAHTTQHGAIANKTQLKDLVLYNLDVIISVGYRVKSIRGTQFRQWANKVLKEYLNCRDARLVRPCAYCFHSVTELVKGPEHDTLYWNTYTYRSFWALPSKTCLLYSIRRRTS